MGNGKSASACDFSGVATTQSPATQSGCSSLLGVLKDGTGSVPSPTGKGSDAVSSGSGGKSGSKGAAAGGMGGGFVGYGGVMGAVWAVVVGVAGVGMVVL